MEPPIIALAFALGMMFRQFGYPPLLGYLMAGFIGNAMGLGSHEALAPLADAGVLLLLFTIGLKLNPRDLAPRYVWGSALLHMFIAVPLTTAVIYLIGMIYEPLAFVHAAGPLTLAFALSFSSTVLAIKLFEERGESASFYASIAIGILVIQDLLAVIYLVATSGHWPTPWALLLLAAPLLLPLFRHLLSVIGHGELLLLAGVVFTFGAGELFQWVGLKAGLGALLMGMLLANAHPSKSKELYEQLLGMKNLLLIGFFLQIGYYGIPRLELVYIAVVLGVLVLLRPIIYFSLLTWMGLRARTGWLTGLALFNFSEFGLIVAAIAHEAGVLREQWLTTLALAMAISYVLAIPINRKAHDLYIRHGDRMRRFERDERLPEEVIGTIGSARVAVLGMGRIGRYAFDALRDAGRDDIVGVEENYQRTLELNQSGMPCVHGDASDRDFWERAGLVKCELILVCLSNHREHLRVARLARELGYANDIAVATRFRDENAELEALGCLTFYRYEEVGREFADHTLQAISRDR